MYFFTELLQNKVILCSIIAWAIAQFMKIVHDAYKTKSFSLDLIFSSGGFPSSHTSFVTSLAGGVGFVDGFDSTTFAISVILAFVVMYDAIGVRRAAGTHARIINDLVLKLDGNSVEERLEELLGHTPLQVLGGLVLGIIVSVAMFA